MMALLMAGLFAASVDGFCWGQKGHDVTCAVAQRHLTRKAARKIDEILDGKTIVYWANGPGRWKSSFYAAACGLPLS